MKQMYLLGSPVAHSKSPLMHNESFSYHNLNYQYSALDVKPEELASKIEELRNPTVRGFNLTMPHKTAACQFCNHLSPAAKLIGSINTVVNENGVFTGYSTDGIGFMRAISEAGCEIKDKKMTILGAGGAATSIFVQAALDGVAEITIFSRRSPFFARAEQIMEQLKELSPSHISLYDFDDESVLKREIETSSLLVNATSVGMAPNTDASIITDTSMFHKDLFVVDIIYNPSETKFLRLAREAGCKTQNGLNMLLYQGAEAFKLWTGYEMPVELVKEKFFT